MVRARQWDSALSDEYEQLHRSPAADFKQFRPGEKRPANRAGGPSVKKAHYRHRPLLRACRERPSGRTTKKHDERARNKAEEGLTCIFFGQRLAFFGQGLSRSCVVCALG